MICGYDPLARSLCSERTGLYAETKNRSACIDVLSSDTAACFFIISRRYLQLKQDQDFPDLVKACSLCSTVLLLR